MRIQFSNRKLLSLSIVSALWLTGCGQDSNTSTDDTSALCQSAGAIQSTSLDDSALNRLQVHPEVFSPDTAGLIVKTRTKVLLPSGNPIREFSVKGISHHLDALTEQSFSVKVEADQDMGEVTESLLKTYDIEYIEPDFQLSAAEAKTSSKTATSQWAHDVIDTYEAWDYTEGAEDVVVAVIDSGVDIDHTYLRAAAWVNPNEIRNGRDDDGNGLIDDIHGWNYVEKNNKVQPSRETKGAYHGTHVAGIIAGQRNLRRKVSGVAPRAKLMSLKFLDHNKNGNTSHAIKGIYYAINKKVKIINASWGSYNKSTALQEAIRAAEKAGILFVAASGNYGGNNDTKPFYPASYNFANIVSVTASSSSDKWVSGINYGSRSVDFAAPGSNILSTDSGNGYLSRGGSSMAAPFVAGAAALALSMNPKMDYKQMKALLVKSSDRVSNLTARVSNGHRLNAYKAVSLASKSDASALAAIEEEIQTPNCSL